MGSGYPARCAINLLNRKQNGAYFSATSPKPDEYRFNGMKQGFAHDQ